MEWILRRFSIICLLISVYFCFCCYATTDELDVLALQDLYNALSRPQQLKGWTAAGPGDPCEQSWTGIECFHSSVIHIKLHGLELEGFLGDQLFNLRSLKILDISSNNIQGVIPDGLPPNVTQLNLSSNKLSLSIPHSLSYLRNLRHLNLSHNMLSGPIGSVFRGLENLMEMDLSYNKFSGDLPSSFANLTHLKVLYLQNNELTGSVVYLADLQLTDLNIQDNHFSGILPEHFQTIPNLWFGGNEFNVKGAYAPWTFPLDKVPNEQSLNSPPMSESSAIEKKPFKETRQHKKKGLGVIALGVSGTAFGITLIALGILVHIKRSHAAENESLHTRNKSICSFPVSSSEDQAPVKYEESPQVSVVNAQPMDLPTTVPAFAASTKSKGVPNAKRYTLAEIQSATRNFRKENFLGEGSLGSVYRAEFPDGQMFVVKNINLVSLSFQEEDKFMEVLRCISCLHHPNIVHLAGYCVEQGRHLLVYEYVRDLTLDKALHSKLFLPLSWEVRIKIALGVAQALDYMHNLSIAHCNLKAANIMLEEDLMPRVCDSGLSILRPLTTNNTKVKASEMAINDSGYIAQEHGQTGIESMKADVYAFGVLLLELITGRKPFDSSRPTEEQSLVQWAKYRLHDCGLLDDMVDPNLKGSSFPLKALSRCADIISLCVQPEKEFRPQMSEIAEVLRKILPKPVVDGMEGDAFEKSFRSTKTRFSEMA